MIDTLQVLNTVKFCL